MPRHTGHRGGGGTLALWTPSRVELLSSERVYDGFFSIDKAVLRHECFDGRLSEPLTRLVLERGDAVAVLPYDRARRQVVLICQFRYPAHVRGHSGWLWEIIAGMQEPDWTPEQGVRREAMEEAGLCLGELYHSMTVFPSPGGATEQVHLYVAPLRPDAWQGKGGGLADSGEDIRVRTLGLEAALRMICSADIVDAKTILALQYLAMHWDALPDGLT